MNRRFAKLAAVAAAGTLALSACAANEPAQPSGGSNNNGGEQISGQFKGQGSSAQKVAQDNWIKDFQTKNSGATITYAPDGSGAGRDGFKAGGLAFAGSDRAYKADELAAGGFSACAEGTKPIDVPVYVSPIAISFNVEGVKELNLDAATAAKIFRGEIQKWNDPAIMALNSGAQLPDLQITTVHRSDNSGTTENFTDWMSKAAPQAWTDKASGDWPGSLKGEAAKGTSGVVAAIKNGKGTIGYVDESQARELTNAKIGKDGKFEAPTAEGAAKVLEKSPVEEGREPNDLAIKIDRKGEGYPVMMVSYALACSQYKDAKVGKFAKAYVGYMGSADGQQLAAKTAGAAPLPSSMQEKVKKATDAIK